ncbi:MAG: type I-C CRISPR-associated endonuclease Cas1 [Desulfamplus sp.]|nr:type I-C CRISPR-associated endonuclease Cas1 [Desulfamplus sp.]
MKNFLNTLFVTTQGSYLFKDGLTIAIKVEDKVMMRIPVHTVAGIICFGQVSCSPYLMAFCAENNVSISFLTEDGRFLASVRGTVSGNVLLRRQQFRMADDPQICAKIASSCVTAKLANCRTVLDRALRDHKDKIDVSSIKSVSERLFQYIKKELSHDIALERVRGIEGDAAHQYFGVFDNLIVTQKDDFFLNGRNRRPPLDNMNCLLSYLYTILSHDVRSALESVGLDPAVGFLHRDRPGRYGLALDLMEEFRPFIADRLALSLVNLRQIKKDGFDKKESGAVLMNDETRKIVLTAYQARKKDEIIHPFINEKIQVGNLFHLQALLLARYIRGDIDGYPPFIWK